MFTNQASLEEVYDFVGANNTLFNDFQQVWQQHASPGFIQLPIINILKFWIAAQKSVDVVVEFGHNYAVLSQVLHGVKEKAPCGTVDDATV